MKPVDALSNLFKTHINIILPYMPGYAKWSPSLRSPHHNPVYSSPLPNTCYMPRLSQSSGFDHLNHICWGVQIIKLPLIESSSFPCYLVPLRPTHPPQHPIFEHPQPTFLHNVSDQVSHPYIRSDKIIALCILIFTFLGSKLEDKGFCTE